MYGYYREKLPVNRVKWVKQNVFSLELRGTVSSYYLFIGVNCLFVYFILSLEDYCTAGNQCHANILLLQEQKESG